MTLETTEQALYEEKDNDSNSSSIDSDPNDSDTDMPDVQHSTIVPKKRPTTLVEGRPSRAKKGKRAQREVDEAEEDEEDGEYVGDEEVVLREKSRSRSNAAANVRFFDFRFFSLFFRFSISGTDMLRHRCSHLEDLINVVALPQRSIPLLHNNARDLVPPSRKPVPTPPPSTTPAPTPPRTTKRANIASFNSPSSSNPSSAKRPQPLLVRSPSPLPSSRPFSLDSPNRIHKVSEPPERNI